MTKSLKITKQSELAMKNIAMKNIEAACAMALKYGKSKEWIADHRAKLMAQSGL